MGDDMKSSLRKLQRDQLSRRVAPLARSSLREVPPKGWIRAIRESVGLTSGELARRAGLSQAALFEMEQREALGKITLKSLQKAGAALDCELIYALVPRKPLERLVETRCREAARRAVEEVAHSMKLEDQQTSKARRKELTREVLKRRDG